VEGQFWPYSSYAFIDRKAGARWRAFCLSDLKRVSINRTRFELSELYPTRRPLALANPHVGTVVNPSAMHSISSNFVYVCRLPVCTVVLCRLASSFTKSLMLSGQGSKRRFTVFLKRALRKAAAS